MQSEVKTVVPGSPGRPAGPGGPGGPGMLTAEEPAEKYSKSQVS